MYVFILMYCNIHVYVRFIEPSYCRMLGPQLICAFLVKSQDNEVLAFWVIGSCTLFNNIEWCDKFKTWLSFPKFWYLVNLYDKLSMLLNVINIIFLIFRLSFDTLSVWLALSLIDRISHNREQIEALSQSNYVQCKWCNY